MGELLQKIAAYFPYSAGDLRAWMIFYSQPESEVEFIGSTVYDTPEGFFARGAPKGSFCAAERHGAGWANNGALRSSGERSGKILEQSSIFITLT